MEMQRVRDLTQVCVWEVCAWEGRGDYYPESTTGLMARGCDRLGQCDLVSYQVEPGDSLEMDEHH